MQLVGHRAIQVSCASLNGETIQYGNDWGQRVKGCIKHLGVSTHRKIHPGPWTFYLQACGVCWHAEDT